MVIISRHELVALARTSRLNLPDDAEVRVVQKLDAVLSYAQMLAVAAAEYQGSGLSFENEPVTRPDVVISVDPAPFLKLAPAQEEKYFVVPVVVELKRGN